MRILEHPFGTDVFAVPEQEDMVAGSRTSKPLAVAGIVLGIGLGGFVDGILLHQIWQVHAMLSAKVPLTTMENMQTNMTADGMFHAVVWVATLTGIIMLFNAARRPDIFLSARVFYGSMLAGWGTFNVVEGIIDHHILEVHHVVERLGQSMWDWLFLGCSVVLIFIGRKIASGGRAAA
jgi:uncharacterized membrane protein